MELDDGRRKEGLVAPAQSALRPTLRGRSACAPRAVVQKLSINQSSCALTCSHLAFGVLMTKHSWLARGASVRLLLRPFPLPFAPLCLFSLSLCPLSLILWSLACSPNMQRWSNKRAASIHSSISCLRASLAISSASRLSLRICAQGCLMCLSLLPSCLLLFLLRQ